MRSRLRLTIPLTALALYIATGFAAAEVNVAGKVADENGLAVPFARIELRAAPPAAVIAAETDIAGAFTLKLPAPGLYRVHAERQGFFVFNGSSTLEDGVNELHLTLNHLQDFFQSVDVAYSAPAIDPEQPAEQKQLNSVEILNAPFPNSQDLRYAPPPSAGAWCART